MFFKKENPLLTERELIDVKALANQGSLEVFKKSIIEKQFRLFLELKSKFRKGLSDAEVRDYLYKITNYDIIMLDIDSCKDNKVTEEEQENGKVIKKIQSLEDNKQLGRWSLQKWIKFFKN